MLVVEPDDEYAALMETLLRQVGWSADREVNGAAALREASEREYVLALVDSGVMLESGVSLLRELRSATSMPLIALSGEEDGESAVRRAIEHADYELVRPFSPRRFRAAIRTVTQRGRLAPQLPGAADAPDEVDIGALALSRGRLEARVGERRIELSPREFSLLYFLGTRPGVVFTREELAHAAWGWEHLGDSRAVDNVVRRLREKIESDPGAPQLLLTERGAGYRLGVP